jgi:hypothetical protein
VKNYGSAYVAIVLVALIGYFGYQWWLNPSRAVKRRLGEVAATLSVPDGEADVARIARLAQLRRYLSEDLRLRVGPDELKSRDAAVATAASWKPQDGSGDVRFADVQVFIESDTAAHAYLAVELTTMDRESGHSTVDARDASVSLVKQNGEWVITAAEAKGMPAFQPGRAQDAR